MYADKRLVSCYNHETRIEYYIYIYTQYIYIVHIVYIYMYI